MREKMTPNESLLKSNQIKEFLRVDYLKSLWNVFPFEIIDNYKKEGTRDRVYSTENTILAMVYSSTQSDKTLENSVDIFQQIHRQQKERILQKATETIENEKEEDKKSKKPKKGPKK